MYYTALLFTIFKYTYQHFKTLFNNFIIFIVKIGQNSLKLTQNEAPNSSSFQPIKDFEQKRPSHMISQQSGAKLSFNYRLTIVQL